MINRDIENEIFSKSKEKGIVYPCYDKYCFSNIPNTILSLFNAKSKRPVLPRELYLNTGKFKKVILLLIDGFGYRQLMKEYKNHKFFKKIVEKGVLSPITTIFPSTTAAAITTICTGLTVQEHSLPEWNVYFKELDIILETLPFSPLNKNHKDRFSKIKANPRILFKGNTIFTKLKKAGVRSFSFCEKSYAKSDYSKMIFKGSSVITFINSSDMTVKLRKCIEKAKGPSYFFVYFGDVDSIDHEYGPGTEEHKAELSTLSEVFERELISKIDSKTADETLIIMTADHGQLNILPKKTIYLNKYAKLAKNFRRSRNGRVILPTGSPRDVFLHIKSDKIDETLDYLSKKLGSNARVIKTSDAIKDGLFGIGNPTKEFRERVGDLLILPNKNNTVWYEHVKGKKVKFLGHHGGLTRDEMLIPFAVAKLSSLIKN